jgi:hypothetical protein
MVRLESSTLSLTFFKTDSSDQRDPFRSPFGKGGNRGILSADRSEILPSPLFFKEGIGRANQLKQLEWTTSFPRERKICKYHRENRG